MLLLLVLVHFLLPIFISSKDVSFSRMLGTNQYLIISQCACQTTFESNIKDNNCPRSLSNNYVRDSENRCFHPIRVHLIRDPEQKRPPRALYIGMDSMARSIAFVEDIQVPPPLIDSSSYMYSRSILFSNRTHKHLNTIKTEFTIYDQSYQFLYLITRNSIGSLSCAVYLLLNLFPGNSDPLMFDARITNDFVVHPLNHVRENWKEDPYSGNVFYTTTNGDVTSIHTLPMNRLLLALQSGINGRRVFSYESSSRSVVSVSGGLLFSQHSGNDHRTVYIRSLANTSQHSVGLSCGLHSGYKHTIGCGLPTTIVIVKDWDYCQLRDGLLADSRACFQEREQWLVEEGMVSESLNFWSTALIIVLIMLSTLLLLLILHICWLRRNLDETFEEVQEAANFRYPSIYGQHLDMDISVDRWNY